MTNDMTRGNPTRLIISFTLPVLFGNLCQQLYGMVDSIIVGRAISMEALAAVGATSGISFLVIGCIQGLTAGEREQQLQRNIRIAYHVKSKNAGHHELTQQLLPGQKSVRPLQHHLQVVIQKSDQPKSQRKEQDRDNLRIIPDKKQ